MYALVIDGQVVATYYTPPPIARRLDTGGWAAPNEGVWTDALLAQCGILPVTVAVRPADTTTTAYDYSVQVVAGTPTEVYTPRIKTADEVAVTTANTNRTSLDGKVRTAVQKPDPAVPGSGSLSLLLGAGTDAAPALTAAAIKTASLRSLAKMSNADSAAQAGPIIQRLISIVIDATVAERQIGKLGVRLFDEG